MTTKKPPALKAISGTVQPCRVEAPSIELSPLAAIPAAPDWMPNAHAIKEWNRLAALLVPNKLLAEADLSTFGHLCALHGKMVQLLAAGEAPTASMIAQYANLASAFGLAPSWRSKVKLAGEPEKKNAFANNGRRTGT